MAGASGDGVLVVGGGLAAARTAHALRRGGYAGRVRLTGAEPLAPYDRPPLSKEILLGEADEPKLLLGCRDAENMGVEMLLGRPAVALHPEERELELAGGEVLNYDCLVIATGGEPRRLPEFDGIGGVVHLRTLQDARELRARLRQGEPVCVVGGGFIGLEVAGAARAAAAHVTVVEAASAPMQSALGPELGRLLQRRHERAGVRFACGATVTGPWLADGRLEGVVLANGRTIAARTVVIAVGMVPTVRWLEGSGVHVHRGVVCDGDGATATPGVYAVGDAACRHGSDGTCLPAGHWTAASQGAQRVAAVLCGSAQGPPPFPDGFFWSDQHGSRIQFAGRPGRVVEIVSGTPEAGPLLARCRDRDRVTGAFAIDRPTAFMRERLALAGPGG